MIGKYKFGTNDAFGVFGIVFRPGTYNELLRRAKKKAIISKSWAEENGTQRFFNGAPKYESITYNIPVTILAANETDFYTKYNAFVNYIENVNYFNFDVIEMNRRFVLLYDDMPSFNKLNIIKGPGEVFCEFNLTLINDYPTVNNVIPAA